MLNSKICYYSYASSQIHCHKSTCPSSSSTVFNGNPIYPHTACIFNLFAPLVFFQTDFLTFSLPSFFLKKKSSLICPLFLPAPLEIEAIRNARMTRTFSITEKEQRNKHWPDILYKSFSFLYNRGMGMGMLS